MEPYTIDPIRTVLDYRKAQEKLQSLFTMVEACTELEASYRSTGEVALAEQAADRSERFSDWAEDLSDAIASARSYHGWGPY